MAASSQLSSARAEVRDDLVRGHENDADDRARRSAATVCDGLVHGEQRRPKGDRQVPEGGGGSAVTLSPDVGPAAGEGDDGALTGRGSDDSRFNSLVPVLTRRPSG